MGIEVVVDYFTGNYKITGEFKGKPFTIVKPIRGIDNDGYYKASFSKKMIKSRRKELSIKLKELKKGNKDFEYSEELIKNIDPLLYKTLESWDDVSGTNYASEYLKTMAQSYKDDDLSTSKKTFEKKCKIIRKNKLKDCGIDISYNVGFFNTNSKLKFFDKIRGLKFAKLQEKFFGAKVNSSIIVDESKGDNDIISLKEYYGSDADFSIIPKKDRLIFDEKEIPEKKEKETLDKKEKSSKNDKKSNNKASESKKLSGDISFAVDLGKIKEKALKEDFDIRFGSTSSTSEKKPKSNADISFKKKEEKTSKSNADISFKQKHARISNDNIDSKPDIDSITASIKSSLEKKRQQGLSNPSANLKIEDIENKVKNRAKSKSQEQNSSKKFVRHIKDPKDSIKNKKYNSSNKNGKRKIIVGAVSLLAAGLIAIGIHYNNSSINNLSTSKNVTTPETTITTVTDTKEYSGNSYKSDLEKDLNNYNQEEILQNTNVIDETTENNDIQNPTDENKDSKSKEDKINEFKLSATEKCKEAMVIGEKLQIGDLLSSQTFSENPDGTGNFGYFSEHKNYSISHINIITKDGWNVVETNGKNLEEILSEYPDCETYNIHFIDNETGYGLGFVTQDQYEKVVNENVNNIINNKMNKNINQNIEIDDNIR